jgi:hypothetical protein
MEPSIIVYWKDGKFRKTRRVFTSEEEISEWYKHNRSRVDGLSIVVPLRDANQLKLDR